jgi:signal transduction histidine kinase/DNA-binding LacI/PurR family transcriptional regulator
LKDRPAIGFYDENSFYDYHNLLLSGIYEAAQKHGADLIRFSHFTGHSIAKNITSESISYDAVLLDSIRQFKLDGLIFLGWARSLAEKDIRKLFGDLPLFNIGTEMQGIPGACFDEGHYIREILRHLVSTHNYGSIAFIAPSWYDRQAELHINAMKDFEVFSPRFVVDGSELWGLDFRSRGVRAMEILFDERRVKPEAIVSLYSDEAYAVYNELKRRGLRIPEDIALICGEDGEIGRFSAPSFTTVHFPWKELGYFACESMVRQLRGEQIPMRSEVPGRIIYGGSCGCVPDTVKSAGSGWIYSADTCFERLGQEELEELIGKFAAETGLVRSDSERILREFARAFEKRDGTSFLIGLENLFRKIRHDSSNRELASAVAALRRLLLPYFLPYSDSAGETLVWAEDLFFQAQVLLQNKLSCVYFREDIAQKNIRLRLKEIGQILIANFTVKSLLDSLEINLPRLRISGCRIYLFEKDASGVNPDNSRLEFDYRDFRRCEASGAQNPKMEECLDRFGEKDKPFFLTAHILHSGADLVGIALFEPTHMEMGIYQTLALHLSIAYNGILLFEKLDSGYRRLMDQAHKKGMADISTGILHNIGNILNSINVTAHSLDKLLDYSVVNDLLMANALLESKWDGLDDFIRKDPKGKTLMQFYVSLKDSFAEFRNRLQEHVARLSGRIGLIDEIITAQQSYTGVKSNLKVLDLVTVLEDVLKMHQTSMERHGVQLEANYGRPVRAMVNRTKLFHVFTNIVKNAMESMEEVPADRRKLTVSVTEEKKRVLVRITDTGGGIEPRHLGDIFAYGFSTKSGGHGFGLHSCANYMTEMGGRLWAESQGAGTGATFVMQLKKPEDAWDWDRGA